MTPAKIAVIQMRSEYGAVESNLEKAQSLVARATRDGAKLVVLPELFNTGYQFVAQNETSSGLSLDQQLAESAFYQRVQSKPINLSIWNT